MVIVAVTVRAEGDDGDDSRGPPAARVEQAILQGGGPVVIPGGSYGLPRESSVQDDSIVVSSGQVGVGPNIEQPVQNYGTPQIQPVPSGPSNFPTPVQSYGSPQFPPPQSYGTPSFQSQNGGNTATVFIGTPRFAARPAPAFIPQRENTILPIGNPIPVSGYTGPGTLPAIGGNPVAPINTGPSFSTLPAINPQPVSGGYSSGPSTLPAIGGNPVAPINTGPSFSTFPVINPQPVAALSGGYGGPQIQPVLPAVPRPQPVFPAFPKPQTGYGPPPVQPVYPRPPPVNVQPQPGYGPPPVQPAFPKPQPVLPPFPKPVGGYSNGPAYVAPPQPIFSNSGAGGFGFRAPPVSYIRPVNNGYYRPPPPRPVSGGYA